MSTTTDYAGRKVENLEGKDVIRWKDCPDCKGRGWFLIRPFETGGGGAGGPRNMTQCQLCKATHAFYMQHGRLPVAGEVKASA